MAAPSKVPLTRAADSLRQRAVALALADGDKAVAGLIESSAVTPVQTPKAERAKAARRSRSVKEIASGESIAVKPKRGG